MRIRVSKVVSRHGEEEGGRKGGREGRAGKARGRSREGERERERELGLNERLGEGERKGKGVESGWVASPGASKRWEREVVVAGQRRRGRELQRDRRSRCGFFRGPKVGRSFFFFLVLSDFERR